MKENPKIPNEKILLDNLGKIAYTLDKAYLTCLDRSYAPLPFDENYNKEQAITFSSNIRVLQIGRWVYDRDEKVSDCFKNVLSVFAGSGDSLALVIHRTPAGSEMFFVVKNVGELQGEYSKNNINLLAEALRGNFPGTELSVFDAGKTSADALLNFSDYTSIAALSNVPSEKSEDYISQGIDKLLNGIVPRSDDDSYYVVILAESVPQLMLRSILSGYQEMATAITPFAGYQFQAGENSVKTEGSMQSISNSEGISDAVTKTHSINIGVNGGVNSSTTKSKGSATAVTGASIGTLIGGAIGSIIPGPGTAAGAMIGGAIGGLLTRTSSKGIAQTIGRNLGLSGGYGYSWGKTHTTSKNKTETEGTNKSISVGTSENTTYTYKSYVVVDLLKKLEATIKRINESQSTGLWKCASYILTKDAKKSKNIANFLRSIAQGDASYIEPPFIHEWSQQNESGITNYGEAIKYIQHFCHPIFLNVEDGMAVTPTANASTTELANLFAFPRHSVQGLPVLECTRFGREPHALTKLQTNIDIGCAYHMHEKIETQRIRLSKEELTKHTFITGSTGSGKSNTIYKLLENLTEKKVKFLVVEPAKGEYRAVFGASPDVTVYGTNPNLTDTQLLRLNPFRFPKSIHVLEHLDRLVEIFNVCWPMYAAMPAILKDSMERAYRAAGWDLMKSKNQYDDRLFPSFADVLKQIRQVLGESDYSADNKGDYTGSLVTRLRSLTNGINGLIFTADDIADEQLFDGNVIVDLSRVGSTETKALIMGLLVLKLQEHRMDQRAGTDEINSGLRHITVLEEAHNLLKRTSTEQTTEGANLLGKSVEMLANSIAEMRTYGEGFIIADQSPGLLDMSVIRNTNTKIVLRLPDFSDRELVGKAAGLDDKQIIELGRLEKGVAAITQSDWLEPVLCKVDRYEEKPRPKNRPGKEKPSSADVPQEDPIEETLLDFIMNREVYRKGDRIDIQRLWEKIIRSRLDAAVKCSFMEYISAEGEKAIEPLRALVYEFFHADQAVEASKGLTSIEDWSAQVLDKLKPSLQGYTQQQIDLVLALIVYEQAMRDVSYRELFGRFTEVYQAKGGVV